VLDGKVQLPTSIGTEAGITLVGVGLTILLLSTLRFITTTRRIQSDSTESYRTSSVLILGGVFIALSVFVFLYVTRIISIV